MRYAIAVMLWLLMPASAQVLHHHEGMTEAVDRFYSYWLQPNNGNRRITGCCNRIDCYPTETKTIGGNWWFMHRETRSWLPVPSNRVEHLQPDPRESPDGQSHVCARPDGYVYCFVAGSGI